MTRRVVSRARESGRFAVAESDGLKMLAHVADARAEFAGGMGVSRVMLKQMCVRSQHRSATAGIGNDWRVAVFERIDVLPGQSARAFNIAGVRMQGAATHLRLRRLNLAMVNFQDSRRRFVDPLEKSFRHATIEEQNWSARILSRRVGIRRHLACAFRSNRSG